MNSDSGEKQTTGNVDEVSYVGFWARLFAFIIDNVAITLLVVPPVLLIFGNRLKAEFLNELQNSISRLPMGWQEQVAQQYPWLMNAMANSRADMGSGAGLWANLALALLTAAAVLLFWKFRCATPGKMLIRCIIVDGRTFRAPTSLQLIVRYVGYFVSFFSLCLGFFMVGWTRRKQGLHDLLAGTVVIYQGEKVRAESRVKDNETVDVSG